jgi:hypothetical protein
MSRRDWEAMASEVREHLEQLEPNQRPMPLTNWHLIWGMSEKGALQGMRKFMPEILQAYRACRKAWFDALAVDVARDPTKPEKQLDRVGLAKKYHVTLGQMSNFIGSIRDRARRRLAYQHSKKTAAKEIP